MQMNKFSNMNESRVKIKKIVFESVLFTDVTTLLSDSAELLSCLASYSLVSLSAFHLCQKWKV